MSLIVQVNSSNATAQAAAASQPSQQLSNIVTTAAATTVQVAVNAAQSPQGSVVQHVPAMQALPQPHSEPMPNSLATLVAAAEQQSKQKLHQIPTQVRTESTITRIMSPHIVQHHPPPLRMVQLATGQPPQGSTVVTTVALPQAPAPVPSLRHALPLPQSPMVRAPQLPRSPVRQHQLPTAPLQRSLVQQHSRASPVQQLRTGAMTVTNGGQQCIMVNNPRTGHLSMLPQNPTPGLMPSAASVQGLLPQSPSTFVPLPAAAVAHAQAQHHHHHRIQQTVAAPPSAATVVTNNSTTILPPTLMNRQLFSRSNVPLESVSDGHLRSRLEMGVDTPAPISRGGGRNVSSSSRQQRDRRSLPCQLALQDHNYVSRPPPTPSPPPPPPPVVQDKRLQPGGLQMHPNQSFNSSNLRGLVPEMPSGRVTNAAGGRFAIMQQQQTAAQPMPAQASPAGLLAAVTGPPGSNATAGEPIGASVLPSRIQANLSSIEEAGVGPMAPLVEDDNSHLSNSSTDEQERGGEETETAPEGEPEDDSITRCICDYLHDDGYMICCDKCLVWQHVVCMGLDRNNIPDEYLCEVCKPRPIDRKRAKALQSRRRSEIFNNSSSSDDDKRSSKDKKKRAMQGGKDAVKKILNRKAATAGFGSSKKTGNNPMSKLKKGASLLEKAKKQYKKRKQSEGQGSSSSSGPLNKKVSPKKSAIARRKSQTLNDSDLDSEVDHLDEDLEPMVDASQNLRSWIDQYEEAVTNHYSPELRARLAGGRLNAVVGGDLKASAIGGPTRCNVSLKGNGIKILTANNSLINNTPIIECKGRFMLAAHYRSSNKVKGGSSTPPYVFFHSLGDVLEICLDGKTYGNDSRFCRRSQAYNAELRHVIDKGSLHLFIVAIKSIEKNQEILLPPDGLLESQQPLPSINADLKEIKKPAAAASSVMNGMLNLSSPEEAPLASRPSQVKKEKKKVKVVLKGKGEKKPTLPRKKIKTEATTVKNEVAAATVKTEEIKSEPLSDSKVVNGSSTATTTTSTITTNTKVKVEESVEEEEDLEEEEVDDKQQPPVSPSKNGPPGSLKGSPSKLGLPDNSGLIVGVNTINYDASSAVRNKAQSREERKMEMIMKAIEAMEKKEQRKGGATDDPTKRRRSSSSYRNDSNLDASSADETKPEPKARNRKKGRKSGPGTPQRRRSRVMSGGSASNMSADEIMASGDSGTPNHSGPFRFPKTKKSLMSDWLESESNSVNDDDDVSANYLKGSRSPPGIATHLLRSTANQSPVKNQCSAKKRWLRQAISEDHTEEVMVNGSASPSSETVHPLKKRRLANYKEDQEQENEELETNIKVPNGLKKQILQNLVLEAVLDKAMEDMLSSPSNNITEEKKESPFKIEDKKETIDPLRPVVDSKSIQSPTPAMPPASTTSSAASIRAPEPNSAFKSFFKTNVSLEELEAEIAATRKQRESTVVNLKSTEEAQFSPVPSFKAETEHAEVQDDTIKSPTIEVKTMTETSTLMETSATSNESNKEDAKTALKVEKENKDAIISDVVQDAMSAPKVEPMETAAVIPATAEETKPKTKKRFSLADYKSLRRVSSSNPPSTPSTPSVSESASAPSFPTTMPTLPPVPLPSSTTGPKNNSNVEQEPGTPTQDETTSLPSSIPSTLPPSLSTLPLFEKLDKLEMAQQEMKRKASNNTFMNSPVTSEVKNSPIIEPKREDLTSRLQKEFGLLVDNDANTDDTGGDATPEEDNSPPPPPPAGSGSGSARFLPSQIPSYTTQNYQSSSSSSTSVPPPQFNRPPPNTTKYPPPPAPVSGLPGGPLGFQGNLNFPPPPPPVNYGKSAHEDPLPSSAVSQPLPPPPPAPLPALKSNGPSMTSSSRRPPSKDYYNRGSPGSGGGRGYYTSNSHRSDRGRDHRDRDHRERDRDHRDRVDHRERRDDRDHRDRDRDHQRERDYRSQSSSRRNAYQSRSYY